MRGLKGVVLLLLILLSVSVCSDDDPVAGAPVTVQVTGPHGVLVGESIALEATTAGAADTAYAWASSRSDVASVDSAGVVTALSPGEATIAITGADSGATGTHAVVVTAASEPVIVVTVTGNPFVKTGSTVMLDASTAGGDDASYAWSSSDQAVATVDEAGVVTGRQPGEVVVTATGSDTGMSGALTLAVMNEVPFLDAWKGSGHADYDAEAFNHWNEDMPAEVPTSCARCHSTPGFVDFVGGDGSAAGEVNQPAPLGTVVECGACHNSAASNLSSVTFPSGETIDDLGAEARCMTCHQGRSSGDDVDEAIASAAVGSDDEVSTNLGFLNIHYYAAAATINAGRVRGGYQYADQVYDWRFRHAPTVDDCTGCHDPHSLEVRVDRCNDCHTDVTNVESLKDIRTIASLGQDYDGDGDLLEGIYYEIDGLRTKLLAAIVAYSTEQGSNTICYDDAAYPYWFIDTDQSGSCEPSEANYGNRWQAWTARLLKAAYNFQVASKDPGNFAHNAKYTIQLLHDAITDLNVALTIDIDMANAIRNDSGHFNGASEAARHWDEDEAVSSSCSKCHGGSEGFRFYLEHGAGLAVSEPDNGLDCATCHETYGTTWSVLQVDEVTYPGGTTLSDPGQLSNVCATCHAGRTGKADIDAAIADNDFRFLNVHYLPAAGIKEGTNAKVGYEYDNKSYAGEWAFHGRCVNCHDPVKTNHTFLPEDNADCTNGCHSPTPIIDIRTQHTADYDGDSSSTEPLKDELKGYAEALLSLMNSQSGLCYDEHAYPYFFIDGNSSGGVCDAGEAIFPNRFLAWTPALMKAAHNVQIFRKEPGAWAHNFDYVAQLLYDSLEDIGGSAAVSGFIRP